MLRSSHMTLSILLPFMSNHTVVVPPGRCIMGHRHSIKQAARQVYCHFARLTN